MVTDLLSTGFPEDIMKT